MSIMKGISTYIGDVKAVNLRFPDKKTIIFRGDNGIQLLYIIESLLSTDMSSWYLESDKKFDYHYAKLPTKESRLTFTDGQFVASKEVVTKLGVVPNIHCIRGLCNGYNELRSFFLSQDGTVYSDIYTDLTEYSAKLLPPQWFRLVTLTNQVLGCDFVTLSGTSLSFDESDTGGIALEDKKFVYLLLGECFLTYKDCQRVILLPDISGLSSVIKVKLLAALDDITGHLITLSTMEVSESDISSEPALVILPV